VAESCCQLAFFTGTVVYRCRVCSSRTVSGHCSTAVSVRVFIGREAADFAARLRAHPGVDDRRPGTGR